ncbi:hypothetical protein XaC1_68 [Xanthomonas phage XaC1]|nr:hypothetical protein XaC1_68 [Xanthomonas phage XaC1]
MKLVTALAKKFFVEESSEIVEDETVSSIFVYEEEDDAEHMVRFSTTDNVNYTVNNVFSNLAHGTVLTEKEIKALLKNNSIKQKE